MLIFERGNSKRKCPLRGPPCCLFGPIRSWVTLGDDDFFFFEPKQKETNKNLAPCPLYPLLLSFSSFHHQPHALLPPAYSRYTLFIERAFFSLARPCPFLYEVEGPRTFSFVRLRRTKTWKRTFVHKEGTE